MPIGGSRVSFQTPVIRNQQPATTAGDAQLSTAQSKFGATSLNCDGTGDYVRTGTTGFQFNSGDPFTVEAWFRSNGNWQASGYNGIVGVGNTHASGGSSLQALYVRNSGSTFQVWSARGFDGIVLGNTQVAINTWHHAALQRHANNLCEMYVNGVKQNTTSTQANQMGQNSGGAIGIFTDNVSVPFRGWIDEVRISNIARYSGASFTLQTEPFINDLNTLYLYHMDGASGSRNIVDDIT